LRKFAADEWQQQAECVPVAPAGVPGQVALGDDMFAQEQAAEAMKLINDDDDRFEVLLAVGLAQARAGQRAQAASFDEAAQIVNEAGIRQAAGYNLRYQARFSAANGLFDAANGQPFGLEARKRQRTLPKARSVDEGRKFIQPVPSASPQTSYR
jgi:hypothetical protein